jgi:hypothetical protein
MQRLNQEQINELCNKGTGVTEEHIREHERLMAEFFLENPHLPRTALDNARIAERERRMHELHALIYEAKSRDK